MKRALVLIITLIFAVNAFGIQLGENLPDIHGFIEGDFGLRLEDDITRRDDYNLFEQRFQLRTRYYPDKPRFLSTWNAELNLTTDFLVDWYFRGRTSVDFRELNISFTPIDIVDIKIGRQILTWGTGDYLFVNDIFPKDYESFFIGRDDEYLKKPSDALRVLLYPNICNVDIVFMPYFVPDTIPDGERLSFYDQIEHRIAGDDIEWHLDEPPRKFENTELAGRLYRNFGSYEGALYFYRGFYRSPVGMIEPSIKEFFYPRLDEYGTSLRGPMLGGVGNLECGYYNSRDDAGGDDPFIQNSSYKILTGYEKDLGNDLRIGFQYLYEDTIDGGYRHLVTSRVTKLLIRQTLMLSLFTFYSPTDDDIYLRPLAGYDITDNLQLVLGANLIWGKDKTAEFGQMENNKNVYVRIRYSF